MQIWYFLSQKQGLSLSVSSSGVRREAGGGNERVMRLFLPSAQLEKTDEPGLANKAKTIREEGERERHTQTK